jgi:drug/metabolite transporter (DMT)-like permease
MKPTVILAIVLIVAGVVVLTYQGFTYTTRENVVDIGSVHVMADKTRSVSLPPLLGAIAIVGGLVLLVVGRKS